MKESIKLSVLVAALAFLLAVVPAIAAAHLDVHIEVLATLNPDPDPFTASGPAVDAGVICPTGDATDLSVIIKNPSSGKLRILQVLKRFQCQDATGTFDVKLVVKLDLTSGETTANWNIVGGTGDYVGLHGNGKLAGDPIVLGVSIMDIYDGKVH